MVVVVLAIAIAVYFSYNPENSQYFPQCPFHYLTGLDCPGCGSQRATHHLLHFQIGKAFVQNPLMVLAIPYLIVGIWFEYFGAKQKYPAVRKFLFGKTASIIIFFIVVVYWLGRNLIKYWL